MSDSNIHILCTGDLHLGRHPSKIPVEYDSRDFSPAFIWEKTIQKAIELGVEAVIISGDIIDRDNRFYEAFGPFEAGIKRLAANEISVFAVAGNHDYNVLPRFARNISTDLFFLLGSGGKWESQSLKREGKPILNLIGWSYPNRRVRKNPIRDFRVPTNELPSIGLLHSEVGNPGSNYAPVSVDDLQETGVAGWVLGHIHRSSLISEGSSFILNPGTPQPLNPGEPGLHGVWEVVIKPGIKPEIVKYPLSSLRYVNIEIDISGLEQVENLPSLISQKLEAELNPDQEIFWTPELIMARLTFKGRTELSRQLEREKERLTELELEVFGCRILIEKIYNQTRPEINIEELAEGNSQVALIARYLSKLESGNGDELPVSLMEKLKNKLLVAYNANAYQPLRNQNRVEPPDDEEIFSILERQARHLLDSLLAQKEEKNDGKNLIISQN